MLFRSNAQHQQYTLKLYVAGSTQKSMRAITNTRRFCEKVLLGRYQLDVIDIDQDPALAQSAQIIAVPTLIRTFPSSVKRIIGQMDDSAGLSLWDFIEIGEMRARLEEAEETLDALREGRVDALVVTGGDGENIVSLKPTLQDIAERKHYEELLEYQANFDTLTGLANRHRLDRKSVV